MKQITFIIAALCAFTASAQVPVAPVTVPHVTFVTGAGLPCAGCSLFTYAGGTTNPLATYSSAAGTSQNTNPVILDAAGGANIWVAGNSYKFVLKDTLGSTIWTVDQVTSGGALFACATPNAVLAANSSANGSTCDSTITINTTNHTINVGTLPTNHVTMVALGTPTSWTLDTTSPATALASMNGGSVQSVGLSMPGVIFDSTVPGSPVTGTGVLAPTLLTQSPGLFFAGPCTGSPATPTMRVLCPGDLPLGSTSAFGAVKCDGTTITCTSGVIAATGSAAVCNMNGCYITLTGGTIVQWGAAGSCGSGAASCNASVTFPTAFSSTANLAVTVTPIASASNVSASASTPSTTGFNVMYGAFVFVGGSGSNLSGSQTATWMAVGK